MTTHTWLGGTGSWFTASDWSGNAVPQPDDAVIITTGTVSAQATALLAGGVFDAETLTLGSALSGAPAELDITSSAFGERFTIASSGMQKFATLASIGAVGFAGAITADARGGLFAIDATAANGDQAGDFELLDGSELNVSNGDNMVLTGHLSDHGSITISAGGILTDNGEITQSDGLTEIASGGTLLGSGSFIIGLYSSLYLDAGATVGASQVISFDAPGGRLLLGSTSLFTGEVDGFAQGDLIDLTSTLADYAVYSADTGVLTVRDGGADGTVVASMNMQGLASGTLDVTGDGASGSLISLPGSAPLRTTYTIAGDSDAIGGMATSDHGTPLTGTDVKIGIISDSFNTDGLADTEAQEGFLPLNTANDTSAVTVLHDDSGSDEGRAMAELVHKVAPGAQLYFYAAGETEDDFANAVTALQQAGANIIVDDISEFDEPFFQDAGPVDDAIETAIADGVSYFSAAGNYGSAFYEANFSGTATRLHGSAQTVSAYVFDNGTPYQTITIPGGLTTTVQLQWNAAWPTNGAGVPDSLVMKVYNLSNQLVATSTQIIGSPDSNGDPAVSLTLSPLATTQYQVAIYQPSGTPSPGLFKYILFGGTSSANPGGTIDDPQAGTGSGIGSGTVFGHADLPNVNTVGAVDFANAPALGDSGTYTDYFSSTGPIDFVGPDGAPAAVPGFAPFYGTSAAAPNAAAVAALMLQANPNLTPAKISALLAQSALDLGLPANQQGAGMIQAQAAVALAEAACYAVGSRILTASGERRVEELRVGDCVFALRSRRLAPVTWLGHRRIDCRRHSRPQAVWPVRVSAGAFAPGMPHSDLLLSPDHAVFVDGALLPVRTLLNGATIRQMPMDSVTYWHVELDHHDVLLAQGLPTESYLDTGNRACFANGGNVAALHPDFALAIWRARGCAPLILDGSQRLTTHERLRRRAEALGHVTTNDPDLHVLAAGRRITPLSDGPIYCFSLPSTPGTVLRSHSTVPAEMDSTSNDTRRLGVAIAHVAVDGKTVPLESLTGPGWHENEGDWRWTDGEAALPEGRSIVITLAITESYWKRRPGALPLDPAKGYMPL